MSAENLHTHTLKQMEYISKVILRIRNATKFGICGSSILKDVNEKMKKNALTI